MSDAAEQVIESAIWGYSDPFRWEGDEAFPEGVSRYAAKALRAAGLLSESVQAPPTARVQATTDELIERLTARFDGGDTEPPSILNVRNEYGKWVGWRVEACDADGMGDTLHAALLDAAAALDAMEAQ